MNPIVSCFNDMFQKNMPPNRCSALQPRYQGSNPCHMSCVSVHNQNTCADKLHWNYPTPNCMKIRSTVLQFTQAGTHFHSWLRMPKTQQLMPSQVQVTYLTFSFKFRCIIISYFLIDQKEKVSQPVSATIPSTYSCLVHRESLTLQELFPTAHTLHNHCTTIGIISE